MTLDGIKWSISNAMLCNKTLSLCFFCMSVSPYLSIYLSVCPFVYGII